MPGRGAGRGANGGGAFGACFTRAYILSAEKIEGWRELLFHLAFGEGGGPAAVGRAVSISCVFLSVKSRAQRLLYGDNVIEKHGINRDSTGDREKTRYLCGKQGIFTRDRALIRPGFIRQLETRASTRSASFFHALGSPGRPHNGGGEAGAYRTRNGAKPLKQGHLRAKRGPLGPSRKSQQQTKRTGFAAHGHSIAETAPEGKRASCANGALIRA